MLNSTRGVRYAATLAILALTALLLTPFLFHRHIAELRMEITGALEPAREASANGRLALAREVGAIRGYLLTRQRTLLVEYLLARTAEEEALRQLRALQGLDGAIALATRRLDIAAHDWNSFNDRLAADSVSPAVAVDRLPDQHIRYRAALLASEELDRAISGRLAVVRAAIGVAERRWAVASIGLGLLAAAAAAMVILILQSTLRQNTLARTDPLTGLYNRRGFAELARRELSRAQRNGSAITLLSFDLDGFKQVNDRHGHAAGDRLLKSVGQAILGTIREIDLGARLGGDEFAVLLPDNRANPPERAVERVRDVIVDRLRRDDWPVTLSVGAVTVTNSHLDIDELIHDSDSLMYRVKHAGKNSIVHESRPGIAAT